MAVIRTLRRRHEGGEHAHLWDAIGYCLDAPAEMPAGSTRRGIPKFQPRAQQRLAWREKPTPAP
jgi:hypothetical protein